MCFEILNFSWVSLWSIDQVAEVFQEDLTLERLTVDSELRRVSDFNVGGMEEGDLRSIERRHGHVESSCIDVWCVMANKHLASKSGNDVLILSMPTSQTIFAVSTPASGELEALATKWRQFKGAQMNHVLVPVNLRNAHWCLVVVDVQKKRIDCWDSLSSFDQGNTIVKHKASLFTFLNALIQEDKGKWKITKVVKGLPQQTNNHDCGIFCIDFMRAIINGCHEPKDVEENWVSDSTIRVARAHIAREIKEREIIGDRNSNMVGGKRVRKKSKKAEDNQ